MGPGWARGHAWDSCPSILESLAVPWHMTPSQSQNQNLNQYPSQSQSRNPRQNLNRNPSPAVLVTDGPRRCPLCKETEYSFITLCNTNRMSASQTIFELVLAQVPVPVLVPALAQVLALAWVLAPVLVPAPKRHQTGPSHHPPAEGGRIAIVVSTVSTVSTWSTWSAQ
jgi:hypothetical protein